MALLTTFVYTSLALRKLHPHIEAAILVSAKHCVSSSVLIFWRCGCHFSFLSSQTPKNLASSVGEMVVFPRRTVAEKATLARVKCISSLFCGANSIPLDFAHAAHVSHALPSLQQFTVGSASKQRMFVWSAKPATTSSGCPRSSSSYRVAMYSRNKIGEIGDP